VAPNADQTRLFADDQHLSTAGQKILADYEYSLIVAPGEISFLAEAPVKTRAAVVDAIFNQIAISQRQRKAGSFNVWLGGDVSSLKMNSGYSGFPNDPGIPAAVTGGIDYGFANGWLLGGAISVGTTTQSFDLGGNFKQSEFAASLYAAYGAGPVWVRSSQRSAACATTLTGSFPSASPRNRILAIARGAIHRSAPSSAMIL
jgi:outer membrane lipase/esterase